jgi:hypothetical protein
LFIIRGKARAKENVYGALGAGGGGEDWRLWRNVREQRGI